jgi:hypothetical protein
VAATAAAARARLRTARRSVTPAPSPMVAPPARPAEPLAQSATA